MNRRNMYFDVKEIPKNVKNQILSEIIWDTIKIQMLSDITDLSIDIDLETYNKIKDETIEIRKYINRKYLGNSGLMIDQCDATSNSDNEYKLVIKLKGCATFS